VLAIVSHAPIIDTVVLLGFASGAAVTILNEFIKQDGWPRWANSLLALLVQGIGIVTVAITHAGGLHGVNWSDVERALFGAVVGFAGVYGPIVRGVLQDRLGRCLIVVKPAPAPVTYPPLPPLVDTEAVAEPADAVRDDILPTRAARPLRAKPAAKAKPKKR
jgi:hypothetical protein